MSGWHGVCSQRTTITSIGAYSVGQLSFYWCRETISICSLHLHGYVSGPNSHLIESTVELTFVANHAAVLHPHMPDLYVCADRVHVYCIYRIVPNTFPSRIALTHHFLWHSILRKCDFIPSLLCGLVRACVRACVSVCTSACSRRPQQNIWSTDDTNNTIVWYVIYPIRSGVLMNHTIMCSSQATGLLYSSQSTWSFG